MTINIIKNTSNKKLLSNINRMRHIDIEDKRIVNQPKIIFQCDMFNRSLLIWSDFIFNRKLILSDFSTKNYLSVTYQNIDLESAGKLFEKIRIT